MPVGPATTVWPTSPMCVTSRNGVAPSVRVTISGGPSRWSLFSGPAHTADRGIMCARFNVETMGCRTRSEEHTSELQSLMRISYAVFCLKKKKTTQQPQYDTPEKQTP